MLVRIYTYNFPPYTKRANPHKADWPVLARCACPVDLEIS